MGYYKGAGVTSGGGSSVAPFQTYLWAGFHTVYQRTTTTTTRKSGVSLATAQSEQGECSLAMHEFSIGLNFYRAFNCKGTKKQVSYAQIGDTNLYELNIVNETLNAKLDGQGWV